MYDVTPQTTFNQKILDITNSICYLINSIYLKSFEIDSNIIVFKYIVLTLKDVVVDYLYKLYYNT